MLTTPVLHRPRGFTRLHAAAMAALALGALLGARGAQAGCDPRDFGHFNVSLPAFVHAHGQNPRSIVGLWHAVYTATDGTDFGYQSFDVWHGDGTEFESADIPPVVGALCVGVWKQAGASVTLNHFGWTWDPTGVPTGSFNLLETITVSADGNSYQGSFDFRPYDTNGNFEPAGEHKGTIAAARITLTEHGAD
jgi:hypothetical protein